MAWKDFIETDPEVLRGKPCLKNTRIPVALVLGCFGRWLFRRPGHRGVTRLDC